LISNIPEIGDRVYQIIQFDWFPDPIEYSSQQFGGLMAEGLLA
jgi:hypothetical protein